MTELAVVGVGDWGENLVRTFDAAANVSRCCHAGDPDTAARLADQYPHVVVTTDYETVLASDVDAVVVATPIDTHSSLVKRALRADKHVFVEKPLGERRAGAARAGRLANERGLVLFVGYLFVHHPLFERVGALVDDEVRSVDLAWNYVGGFTSELVTDYVCHPVSVTTALFDAAPDAVDVTACRDVTSGPGPDAVSCTLSYGETPCHLRVSRISPREANTRVAVETERGISVWDDTVLRRFDEETGEFRTVATADTEPLAAECRAFCRCVERDESPTTDGEFAGTVHGVLGRVRHGCRTNV